MQMRKIFIASLKPLINANMHDWRIVNENYLQLIVA